MTTAAKRSSAINMGLPWRTLPGADGTIVQADRQHLALSYCGILAQYLVVQVLHILRGPGAHTMEGPTP